MEITANTLIALGVLGLIVVFGLFILDKFIPRSNDLTKIDIVESKESAEIETTLKCPNCKSDKWHGGPGGGSYGNIECSNCHKKYNNLGIFGLEEI